MPNRQTSRRGRSQRITRADIQAGRVRVPTTTETKSLLPREPARITVVLKGIPLGPCAYNPRYEGGHERSGVIMVGKALRDHVAENEAANRLAFLYYLRARRNIPTWLSFVYFVGDAFDVEGVPQKRPRSEGEWKPVIAEAHDHLGLPECHPFVHLARDVFLPA